MTIHPVILCGGSGTRLWPLSRGGYPKQFLRLAGEHTLIQQTALRVRDIDRMAAPIVIANNDQRFLIAEQLREAEVNPAAIVLEPVGRNTAPAISVAALIALEQSPDALLLVLPSDHAIRNDAAFVQAVLAAAHVASDQYLVMFGIEPTEPHTGYGYIRRGESLGYADASAWRVEAFVEKPDAQTAQKFLADGSYHWNSGMFMLKASTFMDELRRHQPSVAEQAEQSLKLARADHDFLRLGEAAFAACPSISVDHAVMEKTERAAVITVNDLGWSDIGSWSALAELAQTDDAGNAALGDVFLNDVSNSYVRAEHRMVAAIGVDDLVIVETADAVLVAHRDSTQDVRKIAEHLTKAKRSESVTHPRVVRPWGSYEGVDQGERFQVKRIVVNPGAQLSLQMHHHRAEHWIVVKGTALVTNGNQQVLLSENQSTYIPLGVTHRLANPGRIPLELIEVQSGAYLGEEDIVRFEDNYGRNGS